jgi:hypothetical protein
MVEETVESLRAEVDRLEKALKRARNKRYDGCAWCCASVEPEKRGEGHRICRAP